MHIRQTTAEDRPEIEQLLDTAFGPDRHLRTAYRLREGSAPIDALCFVARREDGECNGHLCATIEFWPIEIACRSTGARLPALLLGPIAVAEDCRGKGLGGDLIRLGLVEAQALGHTLVLLVGDPEYYSRFGFSNTATANWGMPGPVEQRRLMVRASDPSLTLPVEADVQAPLRAAAE
ncbi:GNAT family N-acetyltransferase [Pedomonas mirosovicensis]|uniref:GNAT family N-acetyltransferase n=1 Tax=Pedomonas mirosovicensis TaxID=2908641 RepID=UPI002169AA08|nr:N-acetyltransferase [Pedomonas mirosovicensis]MCH8684294.1 N-acetyltransferase [Pedomonas mirosovicensis]